MSTEIRSVWRRLAISISGSVVVSLAILLAAARYLTAMVADEYRTGARTTTDGDSIGLPLGSLALLLLFVVIVGNAIVAFVLMRRARHSRCETS
jgi:hypothetical protein